MDRYVYFIQAEITKRIKIGIAWNPIRRIKELQVGSPDNLSLLIALRTVNSAVTTERHLHHQFQDCRLHGEWFEPVPELLSFIAEQKAKLDGLEEGQELVYASTKPAKPKKNIFIGPLPERPRKRERITRGPKDETTWPPKEAQSREQHKAKTGPSKRDKDKAAQEAARARRMANAQEAIAKRATHSDPIAANLLIPLTFDKSVS